MNPVMYKNWPTVEKAGVNHLTRPPAFRFQNIPRRVSRGAQDYFLSIHHSVGYRLVLLRSLITVLPEGAYSLREPIPIVMESLESGEWIAKFDEANIAMTGDTPEEARELLAYNIVDAIELFYSHQEALIPDLRQTLQVLLHYIELSP